MTAASHDPGRVRLVAERFEELKGLRMVWVGIVWASVFGVTLMTGIGDRLPPSWEIPILFLLTLPLIWVGMWRIDAFYRETYGRTTSTQPQPAREVLRSVLFGAVVVAGKESGLGFAPFFGALGGFFLWIVIRDWPYRHHMVIGCLGACLSAAGTLISGAPGSVYAQSVGLAVLGVAVAVTGALDHRFLTSSMPGRAAAEEHRSVSSEP